MKTKRDKKRRSAEYHEPIAERVGSMSHAEFWSRVKARAHDADATRKARTHFVHGGRGDPTQQ